MANLWTGFVAETGFHVTVYDHSRLYIEGHYTERLDIGSSFGHVQHVNDDCTIVSNHIGTIWSGKIQKRHVDIEPITYSTYLH